MALGDYFPNIGDFDTGDFRQIILYRWQFDVYAVKNAIEYIDASLKASISDELSRQREYNENGQWIEHEESLLKVAHLQSIFSYAFSSCVLSIYSIIEACLDRYCDICSKKFNQKVQLCDMQGKGIQRALTYLEKVIQIEPVKSNGLHGKIKVINDLRNDLIHRAGVTTPKKAEIYKAELGIELSEEGIIEILYDNAICVHNLCDQFIRLVLTRDFLAPFSSDNDEPSCSP